MVVAGSKILREMSKSACQARQKGKESEKCLPGRKEIEEGRKVFGEMEDGVRVLFHCSPPLLNKNPSSVNGEFMHVKYK